MRRAILVGGCACLLGGPAVGDTIDVGFDRITSNASENVEDQFRLRIESVAGDSSVVDFTFTNDVGIESSISEIYIDNGPAGEILSSGSIFDQSGSSFSWGSASPPDLPGGNALSDPFDVTPGLLGDAQGNPNNGINAAGEFLTVRLTFQSGKSFSDIMTALLDGSLRIGMHVRAIGVDGESDSFVNEPPVVVPLPTAFAGGLAGLGILGTRRRR